VVVVVNINSYEQLLFIGLQNLSWWLVGWSLGSVDWRWRVCWVSACVMSSILCFLIFRIFDSSQS